MNAPMTLTLPELEFDSRLYTATAVLNPAIVLLGVGSHLDVLLAKDHEEIRDREFAFWAARRIRLPHAWRARAIEITSRVVRVRIADETLFNKVVINRFGTILISGADLRRESSSNRQRKMVRVRQLSGEEYLMLSQMNGRELRKRVMRMFANTPGVLPAARFGAVRLIRRLMPQVRSV